MKDKSAVLEVTLNPFLWAEAVFLVLLAVALAVASFVSHVITVMGHQSSALADRLTWLELAALQDAGTLIDAVEVELLARNVLKFDDEPTGLFSFFQQRKTHFVNPHAAHSFDHIHGWAIAKLVERDALEWYGTPHISVVANQNAYKEKRDSFRENGFLRSQVDVQRREFSAGLPFAVLLFFELIWVAVNWQPSNAIVVALLLTLSGVWMSVSAQSEMTASVCARWQHMRGEFRYRPGASIATEELALAFALHGYAALFGSPLEEFARYRDKQRAG